ncbi:acyltransferase [Pollutibacter soli]|uniref:acyltransferase n=1 Tax=Pollutibacter soli TaxID=3034157 RepID=UPI00301410CF
MTTDYYVHPSSVVDSGAHIGKGTRIWHFSHLMPGAKVGENCNIGQNVFIDNNVIVGDRVKIQNNVSLYNGVSIEDDVFLGPSMVFTNVINPRSFIERKSEYKLTSVRKGASIGANATIVCGVEIGMYAFIGAGTVILRDVPSHALMVGNPARQKGWMSKSGEKLQFNNENIAWCETEQVRYQLKDKAVSAVTSSLGFVRDDR